MRIKNVFGFASGAVAGALAFALSVQPAAAAPSGPPIRIGSTLALTGPFAATGLVHKVVGEIFVDDLNKNGGLLGRPVEWVLRDDQSKPDLARTLYEQLVTVDKVDLLMGPYATPNILSAMAVAQRYNMVLVHHTFGVPSLAKYEYQFPTWSLGPNPGETFPSLVFDALAHSAHPPKTIAIVTSKLPPLHFMAVGAREVAKKRGIKEVLYLEWEAGTKDFGPIASRIKDADPDFIFAGAIAFDGNMLLEALKKIDYTPRNHFYLYPTPSALLKTPLGTDALASTVFEEHPPFTSNPVAAKFIQEFHTRGAKAGLPDTSVDVQASASYSAWQVLTAGVRGANSLDNQKIGAWLKSHPVDTITGQLHFNCPHSYCDDLMKVKQVQNGHWVVVWPPQYAAPGAKLIAH
jgi:branched-chain amino acid transport system substrate-binding protein